MQPCSPRSPTADSSRSIPATFGRRRSASTSITFWPAWARVMARFVAVVVLPSSGTELVTVQHAERLDPGGMGIQRSDERLLSGTAVVGDVRHHRRIGG